MGSLDILQDSWQDATYDTRCHSNHEQVANFEILMREAVDYSTLQKVSVYHQWRQAGQDLPNKLTEEAPSKPHLATLTKAYERRLSSARQALEGLSSKTTRTLVQPTPRTYAPIKIGFVEDDEDVEQAEM